MLSAIFFMRFPNAGVLFSHAQKTSKNVDECELKMNKHCVIVFHAEEIMNRSPGGMAGICQLAETHSLPGFPFSKGC